MVAKLCKGHNFEYKVIDIGCGEGMVGKFLYEKGFEEIVGIDYNQEKLDEAKSKKVYSSLELLKIGKNGTPLSWDLAE